MSRTDGYDLWLSYSPVKNENSILYPKIIRQVEIARGSAILDAAAEELERALNLLFNFKDLIKKTDTVLMERNKLSVAPIRFLDTGIAEKVGEGAWKSNSEGFCIFSTEDSVVITSLSDIGVLYGVFSFLRLLQTGRNIQNLLIDSSPSLRWRMLDHWDNLDGSIERGYAGKSLWHWTELPVHIDARYADYARACASIGINSVVLNNVNTQPYILSQEYLEKVAAIAGVFRRYGIKVFLSVSFGSPITLGSIGTADPCNSSVIRWWKEKVAQINSLIPDFGGFLVKADSEGQIGPFEYNRSHADGANMLGSVLAPYNEIVIWRAFVYGQGEDDRAKKAYNSFKPLDGRFLPNVCIQIKNGPIDFHPREPVHPLFGGLEKTNTFMEVQITQEYLGQENHIVYLAPMWKEIIDFNTYAAGEDSTVGNLLCSEENDRITGIAAVANTGDDVTWCGSLFHPVNWYAYGRLAWDCSLSCEEIGKEWAICTFGNDPVVLDAITSILVNSWKACVDYMAPLCLHHIMEYKNHYKPDPASSYASREDWKAWYYHRADKNGLGFDRTRTGSDAVDQYVKPVADMFNNIKTCPEKYLLWFHHVPWDYVLSSGRTMKDELVYLFSQGVKEADDLLHTWEKVKDRISVDRYIAVLDKLVIQCKDAREWRDTCVPYFMSFCNGE